MIEIDGSYLEGGGAILRTAIGLSAVTKKPVKILNIRKNRPRPGLRTQHLEGLKTAAELCGARLVGSELNSTEIEFHPGEIKSKTAEVRIGTAGSVGLVFQNLKLLAHSTKDMLDITIKGGATFGKFSPPMLYIKNVLLPVLGKMEYRAEIDIQRHGFYPTGGANVRIKIHPWETRLPLKIEGQEVSFIHCLSVASKSLQKARVAERQEESAKRALVEWAGKRNIRVSSEHEYADSDCPGSGIVLWATGSGNILGSDSLGERGKTAEGVGKEAASRMIKTIESGASVDSHLSDQLLVFMALAKGKSSITAPGLSNHAKTNIWVIEKFIDTDFKITEQGKNIKIECSGSI